MVEIQSKGPLSAVKKYLKYIEVGHRLCHSIYTKGRTEQSTDIQGKDDKMRGGSGQGTAANAWGDHDTGSKS